MDHLAADAVNRFFVCSKEGPPMAWQPPEVSWGPPVLDKDFSADLAYLGRVLAAMERHLEPTGLTFYITRDVKQELPSYGPNVIAIVLADEWARVPAYAHKVGALFKRYGTRPYLLCNPLRSPSYRNIRKLVQYLHRWLKGLPGRAHLFLQTRSMSVRSLPIYILPLGYFKQEDLPLKAIEDRSIDVFFDGSAVGRPTSWRSPKRYFGTVKGMSRAVMLQSARRLATTRPDLVVRIVVNESFAESTLPAGISYSERLMDAKICLSPRGNVEDTNRIYEAWRYGCIPVTEQLPPLWFHRRSPYLRVKEDWSDLESVVDEVLADPGRLRDMHQRSLDHWRTTCSEEVVGVFMAERLSGRPASEPPPGAPGLRP